MEERFQRTGMLIGEEGLERLSECHVAIFGIGRVRDRSIGSLWYRRIYFGG